MSDIDTIAGYDLWAGSYDAFANPMIAMADWVLDRHPPAVAGKSVVELGCGTGRNAARILGLGAASYTGLDASEGMLALAREKTADARAAWLVADLTARLPLPDASFDLALVTLVFEHFEHLGPVLAEAARILRSGGRLRILEIHPRLVENGTQAHFWHDGRELKLPSHAHDAAAFRQAAEAAGLSLEAVSEWSPPAALVERLPKLAKHGANPVLLEVVAAKPRLDGPV